MPRTLRLVTALLMLAGGSGATPTFATAGFQEDESADSTKAEADSDRPAELMTDADRVIRIENIIRLDQDKLEALRIDLAEHEQLFQETAKDVLAAEASLETLDQSLEALAEAPDPQRRAELETSRDRVEALSEVLREFSDLLFTSENSMRKQIQALEKKIEREKRTLAEIRGLAPDEPAAPVRRLP